MLKLNLNKIIPNSWNCNFLSEVELKALKRQLKNAGPENTPPIIVRQSGGVYEIIDGEQRWKIGLELGWPYIFALQRFVNDLEAKALCVGYNRWRGHLNWLKLFEVLNKDVNLGIDVYKQYEGILCNEEIKQILLLEKLSLDAKQILKEALKKHPEISLKQLSLLALFPQNQQKTMAEFFSAPFIEKALTSALSPFLATKTSNKKSTNPLSSKLCYPKKALSIPIFESEIDEADFSSDFSSLKENLTQKNLPQNPAQTKTNRSFKSSFSSTQPFTPIYASNAFDSTKNMLKPCQVTRESGLLRSATFNCECQRNYLVDFEKHSILLQKQNSLYEHVNVKPRVFNVFCRECKTNNEYFVENFRAEEKTVKCRRCEREGLLNVTTREVAWYSFL